LEAVRVRVVQVDNLAAAGELLHEGNRVRLTAAQACLKGFALGRDDDDLGGAAVHHSLEMSYGVGNDGGLPQYRQHHEERRLVAVPAGHRGWLLLAQEAR